jgi:NADPH2:quinone reductase
MKAVAISRYGGPSTVRVVDLPSPGLAPGEVRIFVRAAGLNPADWKLADGWLRDGFEPTFPYALGFDAAGVIAECGDGVEALQVGDRVVAKTAVGRGGAGACAQETVVPAHLVCPLPDTIDFVEAAALPTAGITAWEALFDAGCLTAGQSLLVNGGAGGTGSFLIQLARMAAARVIATASPVNHAYVQSLGAALAIDYRRDDLAAAVTAWCPGGVDLLIDTVGRGRLACPLECIRDGGVFITIGTLVRDEPRPSAEIARQRGIRMATATSSRSREAGQLRALVEALADRRIVPPAIETLPAHRAAEALERLRQGHVRGKLILTLGESDWA